MKYRAFITGFLCFFALGTFAALETGTYISDLVATNPTGSDGKDKGDDHLRLIKSTVKATFPNISGAVTPTHTELNYVDGVTSAIQTQINAKASTATFPNAFNSWTPAVAFGGSSSGVTYGSRTGTYVRLGKVVVATFYVVLTNNGSGTGNMTITGLPFSLYTYTIVHYHVQNCTSNVAVHAVSSAGTSLDVRTVDNFGFTDTDAGNACEIGATFTYLTND